jgi:predicted naringenin-chalcone synthase
VAVPGPGFTQEEILEELILPTVGGGEAARRIFRNSQVERRYTILPDLSMLRPHRSTEERNALYIEHAGRLAALAARRCLDDARLRAADVDEILTISCTGVDTPGPDLWLLQRLGLRPNVRKVHIGAVGCHAALPTLYRAQTAVRADPSLRVLVVSVELCTLHFQHEASMENLVVSALFGDGAAAVLIGADAEDATSAGPSLVRFATLTDVSSIGSMGFHMTGEGFRMHLSPEVPPALEESVAGAVDALLHPAGFRREDVGLWLVHPGGARILDAVERGLQLPPEALRISRQVLRDYGNVSSATSLFLIDACRREGRRVGKEPIVILAFGPGLTLEAALLGR